MEPGYFRAKLIEFLKQDFINEESIIETESFVEEKSQLMASKYEEFRLDGMSIDDSLNAAISEVLESLN